MVDAIDAQPSHPMAGQWLSLAHRGCLDQIAVAELPLSERDVYELDGVRWMALLERAGFAVETQGVSDPYRLFSQYICR
jgi:hypothetical protein